MENKPKMSINPLEKPVRENNFTKMKIICSWCNKDMGEKKVENAKEEITHGICEKCLAGMKKERSDLK